ncbi:hemerythrin HHE cation binding domain-containing protein [Actinocorallia herbida]|uniref:Hemerythrin HHE cation binding domain-containing protein n=1 Tax=Actinocorallia herbida TaxID=58109 RepID=A0A3N1CWQ9_9ACTN|nr:hemerythrin domain-containing protein [Actinocorallia herbida]ROO85732.1 hemerythrin HHE cation binding domain-containing protein [Actinocorallia herbida]
MGEGDKNRLLAWNRELQTAHQRLREALRVTRESLEAGDTASARADLLLYCKGFCAALDGHHVREDVGLFPELAERHPSLRPVIAKLKQDHAMIATLLGQFDRAISSAAPPGELSGHLEGLAAIMESHFRYEERQLLGVLASLELDADPHDLLGPL